MKRTIKELIQLVRIILKQRNGINKEILYINWWTGEKRHWFNDFLISNKILKPGKRFQLVIVSVMGRRWIAELPLGRVKLFFTAEDTTDRYIDYDDYMEHSTELSLGFKSQDLTKNRLNLPLWMLYNLSPTNETKKQDKGWLYSVDDFIDAIEKKHDFESRPYDMALICRHDNRGNGKGNRGLALDTFEKAGFKVLSAGGFRKNTTILEDEFNDDHLRLLQKCKFYICFENTDAPGYTTEKLFDALLCGSIPIYWGAQNKPEKDVLTGNGILVFDPTNPTRCLSIIHQICNSVTFREEFLGKRKTQPKAAIAISNRLNLFQREVERVLH